MGPRVNVDGNETMIARVPNLIPDDQNHRGLEVVWGLAFSTVFSSANAKSSTDREQPLGGPFYPLFKDRWLFRHAWLDKAS
jgi:hypothetical protein